ncbi:MULTISPECIES: hypothetical protein [unclassified Microbacterium]|uniref:hypothetical protein n=1 Tax=unclassified Microbacterium TaxID=2609290 RepID=UPI00386701E1
MPRVASHGFLCVACYRKVGDALGRVGEMVVHLRSIKKPAQPIGERVSTSMERSILIPDTWVAADGLLEALGASPIPSTDTIEQARGRSDTAVAEWADLDAIVNTREGAKRAVVMVRRLQTAIRRWPDSEATWRHVPWMLCPKGGQTCGRSLYRRAPVEYLDELLIECVTPGCGYHEDYFVWVGKYEPVLRGIIAEQDRAEGKRPRRWHAEKSRTSDECTTGDHEACRSTDCEDECHVRRFSLYTNPVPFHVLEAESAATI